VSLTLSLALLTRQQQLLGIHSKAIGARVLALAEVLGLPPADVAQLLLACGALLDVLPLRCVCWGELWARAGASCGSVWFFGGFSGGSAPPPSLAHCLVITCHLAPPPPARQHAGRLHSASQALSTALHLDQHAALAMLAADLNLLDTPPLAIKAFLDGVAVLLAADQQQQQQAPSGEQQQPQQQQHVYQLLYDMAARCPALLRVEAAALVVRCVDEGALLGLLPGDGALA
jgi:hypothetical protein